MVRRTLSYPDAATSGTFQMIVVALSILTVLGGVLFFAVQSVMQDAERERQAMTLLYGERCKELGGLQSTTKIEVCIVGTKLYNVRSHKYRERVEYVGY